MLEIIAWILLPLLILGGYWGRTWMKVEKRGDAPLHSRIAEWEDSIRFENSGGIEPPQTEPVFHQSRWDLDAIEYEPVALPSQCEQDIFDCEPVQADGLVVEEKLPLLMQAQFWIQTGDLELAMSLLQDSLREEDNPLNFLLLLDVYARTGKRMEYGSLRRLCMRRFNARIPSWEERAECLHEEGLAQRTELARRLDRQLQAAPATQYLKSLLWDDRDGKRKGFEYRIFCDLVHLYNLACSGAKVACQQRLSPDWWLLR